MTKKKPLKKKINIAAMEASIRRYMLNHPIFGNEYRKEENIKKFFEMKPRKTRKEI